MTKHGVIDDITAGGPTGNVDIGASASHTADHINIERRDIDSSVESESSGLTSGETTHHLSKSVGRTREGDTLKAKFRAAQASALFDPKAMDLLESLSKKPSFDFQELAEKILDSIMWVKLAVLVRAYLVEPLDNGVRVTSEGSQALKRMNSYLLRLDVEDQEVDLGAWVTTIFPGNEPSCSLV